MGYRGKTVEQEQARELRGQGWTLDAIAAELGVSKSSVSLWVRDVSFVANPRTTARRREPNRLQRAKQSEIDRLLAEGRARIGELTEREFLVAGTALYAGEGAKRDGMVRFTNADPRMVLLFVAWLRRFFPIDERRLRLRLYLHEGLDLDAAVEFWSGVTGIPPAQSGAPYRAAPDRSIRGTRHARGVASVDYCSVTVHRTVMGLVAALLSCPSALPG